jgi:hypothetical protein
MQLRYVEQKWLWAKRRDHSRCWLFIGLNEGCFSTSSKLFVQSQLTVTNQGTNFTNSRLARHRELDKVGTVRVPATSI